MADGFYQIPKVRNEAVKGYAPNSKEKAELKAALKAFKTTQVDIPLIIGGEEIRTATQKKIYPPHELSHCLGQHHYGGAEHVQMAIEVALAAKGEWEATPWQDRVAVFLRAAELIAGPYRAKLNAATMLGQSKNCYQAEIDAAAELIDFLKFNADYMTQIYSQQPPENSPGVWNRLEYRPLEGFIFAVTPFNFTSICANLFATPVMLGNVAVWKPSDTQIYSAAVIMEIFKEAGLPDGVVNMVLVDGPTSGEVVFKHPDFAGLHFTGSTRTFQYMWKVIGENIRNYRSYPRIVGETGGKDFIMVHPSADAQAVRTAISRGAFEYQGQKCSAASRAYIPASLWEEIKTGVVEDMESMKMGTVEDFTNFINAVIDERSFDKIASYIEYAREVEDADAEIVCGGVCDKSEGYFIQPTLIQAHRPDFKTMAEEIFGPVITVYVYEDDEFEATMDILDKTSPYALTGSIFAKDRYVVRRATERLRNCAGNFYINDKPTGAVVGQQPFGGARGSGTNDKAGSILNLYRWLSPRTIKENFLPPKNYRYDFLKEA